MSDDVVKALEAFVLDNPELERLEAMLDEFNPFVAMGWTRQEIRHSAFLRWALDPRETHGLGSYFLRQFLKMAASMAGRQEGMPTVVQLDSWAYTGTTVQAEWRNIDLLIHDDALRLVCVIENKVDSSEHGDQLRRYREIVDQAYPGYRKLFIYLTVDGEEPSDAAYTSCSHAQVATLLEDTLKRRQDQLNEEVARFMTSYVEMVRRNIVEDSEIQRICEQIYQTHRKALDVLFEYRPDRRSEIRDYLISLIDAHPNLVKDHCTKGYVRFLPQAWDALPKAGKGWVPSNRMVLCEVGQSAEALWLKILIGPGDEDLRRALVERVQQLGDVFNRSSRRVYPQFWSFHLENWVKKKVFEEDDLEKVKSLIREGFDHLVIKLRKLEGIFEGIV